MNAFIDTYQYHIAWTVYLVAGLGCSLVWWKITAHLAHPGLRELFRGVALVILFTPWYVSEAREHLAPAIVVVLMDLLIGSSDNGLAGTLALLVAAALMLAVLIVRLVMRSRAAAPVDQSVA